MGRVMPAWVVYNYGYNLVPRPLPPFLSGTVGGASWVRGYIGGDIPVWTKTKLCHLASGCIAQNGGGGIHENMHACSITHSLI